MFQHRAKARPPRRERPVKPAPAEPANEQEAVALEFAEGAEEAIRNEKIRLYFKGALLAVPMNLITGGMFFAFTFNVSNLLYTSVWYAVVIALALVRFMIARSALQSDKPPARAIRYVYLVLTGFLGAAWGASMMLVPEGAPIIVSQMAGILVAGMTAGAALSAAAYPRGVNAFLLPTLIVLGATYVSQGGVRGFTLAGFFVIYYFFIARLANQFGNAVSEALSTSHALKAARTRVESQARALKELARRHELAARKAEEAVRAKSAFIGNIAHEIRTPLNGMMGVTSSLKDDLSLGDDHRRKLDAVEDSGRILNRLVGDLLDLSKIEAGRMTLLQSEFAIDDFASEIDTLWSPRASSNKLDFRISVAGDGQRRILGDPVRLKQIIFNFVSNALKFTREGTVEVAFAVREEGGRPRLRVEVRDTGRGVPRDAEARLFRDYSQINLSEDRRLEGAGLGLAICKRLVDMMEGTIGHSPREEGGSVFWFEASLCWAVAKAADPVIRRSAPDSTRTSSAPVPAPAPAHFAPSQGERPLRILAAEDNAVNRSVLEGFLAAKGWAVDFAHNGQEAVEAANNRAYDLILMDMRMPVMDGLAATRAIRDLPSTAAMTPIVALTANARREDEAACLAAGMDGYVSKPIDARRLFTTIDEVLAGGQSDPAVRRSA
ncbi:MULTISPECIES: response regulator [Hyphobacterium]|uniref:histidine kinase n=1 Tax=Hyphobacterium vulgare TaxID=1736751 RepID=A0ABV6ZZ92_9PROT